MKNISKSQSVLFGSLHANRWLAGAVALLAFGTANAQWSFEPELGVGAERDDNAKLSTRTDDILDVNGLLYRAEIRANYQSQLTDFFITPKFVSRNYDEESELDSNDIFVESLYRYRRESSELRIRLNFDDESARTAERSDIDLDVEDPDDIPDDSTGVVRFEGRRQRIRVRPDWTYDFNDTSSMNVMLNYVDVGYDGQLQQVLKDYSDSRLALTYNRAFSERTIGTLMATGRNYEVADNSSETTGYGLMAGFNRLLTETTRASVLVGIEDVDSNVSKTDPTWVADISLRRRGQTVNALAQYRRTVNASGSGKLGVRDAVNLNLSRRLSERITAGIGMRAYSTNSLDDLELINERDYVQLRAQFIWNITSNFATEVDYRYTFQKRASLEESANSNQVNLWFVYRPNAVDRRFEADLDL